jgi:D-tyrosyl-tRNA(Tyr) deacylase
LHRQTALRRHNQEIQQEMIGLLQRVSHAEVKVDDKTIGQIGRGLMVLVAVHRDDTDKDVARLAERLLGYRVFADDKGRMNRSLCDISGGLLLVPQFTLTADTKKGTRASFTRGAAPDKASAYFDRLVDICRQKHAPVETGAFGADMQVSLTNDGPVTFWLDTK